MQFGSVFSFRCRANDNAKIFWFDGFNDLLQPFSFFGRMDLSRHRDDVVERSNDDKTPGKRYFATEPWALGGNGFFEYLNEDVWLPAKYFVDFACLYDLGFNLKGREVIPVGTVVIDGNLREFEQGTCVGAQVGVMQEGVFFKPNVHECCIQPGYEFFYLSEIKITYSKAGISFFMMQLDQFFVLKQGDLYALRSGIYD